MTRMESSSWEFDDVKAEKASAMRKFNRLRSISKLFRFAEIAAGLLLLSWALTRVPFALTISRDYFCFLSAVVSSPQFVFLICNVIIASLLLKSRHVTASDRNRNDAVEAKLYQEFTKNSGGDGKNIQLENDSVQSVNEDVVYQDKQIISEVSSACPKLDTDSESCWGSGADSEFSKVIRRTMSEKFEKERAPAKLRRLKTEICRKMVGSGGECTPEKLAPADNMSNEEFQRTVEAFIEKQLRFRHQESLAVVLQNQS